MAFVNKLSLCSNNIIDNIFNTRIIYNMKVSPKFLLAALVLLSSASAWAGVDVNKPKHEMRSAWVATVWQLDWPQNTITETGNVSQINQQKKSMITLLDSMAINNMNAINFQVRNRSDAMYKSSYEPWSTDLVSKRGMDPGYDPLEFVVEECHKRGLECHAWVNPYRYESVSGQWSGGEGDYRAEHPDWVMDYKDASILNPGKEEVIQRIVDICREIVTNYDVDGILYDDYFYLNGTPLSADADLYNAYVSAGGTLGQKDWRRDNVNRMIKRVYAMIQEVKPWVRFGVSPAGVACTNSTVAAKYGLERCKSGSDWQYDGIYSDPMAWISQQSLDFISPQIYWTIGYSTADYSVITPWWAKAASKYNRHFFTSHSISSLTASSKEAVATPDYSEGGISSLERNLIRPHASGPNNSTFKEYADEIRLNRECTLDGAPGSIFYSCKYLYRTAPKFGHYLKNTVFSRPAILPAMTYKGGHSPGNVKNLKLNDNILTWEGYDNVRYTVYAVPTNVSQKDFKCEVDYLIATSYSTTFEIPKEYRNSYQYAVCVLDRFGNEYSPIFEGVISGTLDAPVLKSPIGGGVVTDPFDFEWSAVADATNYIVEVSNNAEFTEIIASIHTQNTSVSSSNINNLVNARQYYWRVRSCATNYQDGVSQAGQFVPRVLAITYPADLSTGVSVAPEFQWTTSGSNEGLLEISTDANFMEGTIVFSGSSVTGSYKIPDFTLKTLTTYYARVTMTSGEVAKTSLPISFTTEELAVAAPKIAYPLEGGKLYSEDMIALERQAGVNMFKVYVSATSVFGRTVYLENLYDFAYQTAKGGDIKISSKNLVEGSTYYVRASANYLTAEGSATTDYSDIVSFVYAGQGSGVENNVAGALVKLIGGSSPALVITAPIGSDISAQAISLTGIVEEQLYNGTSDESLSLSLQSLPKGMHLIVVSINGNVKTLKYVK